MLCWLGVCAWRVRDDGVDALERGSDIRKDGTRDVGVKQVSPTRVAVPAQRNWRVRRHFRISSGLAIPLPVAVLTVLQRF